MEPQSPSKSKISFKGVLRCYPTVKLCLIFLAIVLVSGGVYYGYDILGKRISYFTVVVDCGSTGTRVNVFGWRINGGNLPILLHSYPDEYYSTKSPVSNVGCLYHCMQTEPGLDKFVGNISGVRVSLEPLIRWAEGLIPVDRHNKDTQILVLATAGLRRIAMEDARRVLEDVERVVKEHSFMWKRKWIRVLNGKEEAYYGWVALNYKMGYLSNPLRRLPTLGLLDLGGSSLQVVMEVDKEREDSHLLVSKIGFVEHRLMAYSLPAFGLNKAFDRTVAMLSQNMMGNEARSEIRHPCLSSRFSSNYSCTSCSMPDSLHLVGEPNWEKCKLLARAAAMNATIEDWSDRKFDSSCARNSFDDGKNPLNITINTNPGVQYHALSGFFAVYNMLNLTAKANLTKIWEKAQHLCSGSWDNQINVSGSQYCFKVLYLASLFEDSLCLGKANIIFGPGDISWTLGASLIEGEQIWRTASEALTVITPPKYMEVMSSPIFLFIILVLLLFIVYHCQIKLPMPQKRSLASGAPLPSYNHTRHRPH